MKKTIKRLGLLAAALLLLSGLLLPALSAAVFAVDDPNAIVEEVPVWKLRDMRCEAYPSEELYGAEALYAVTQFTHVMDWNGARYSSVMGDLPAVVEDGKGLPLSLSSHISTGDSGSTGLGSSITVIALDQNGNELKTQAGPRISAYGDKEGKVSLNGGADGSVHQYLVSFESLAGRSVFLYEFGTVRKTITGGYWKLTNSSVERPKDQPRGDRKTDVEHDETDFIERFSDASETTHHMRINVYANSEDTKQDGIYYYYDCVTSYDALPAIIRPGDELRVHISMDAENSGHLFTRRFSGTEIGFGFGPDDDEHYYLEIWPYIHYDLYDETPGYRTPFALTESDREKFANNGELARIDFWRPSRDYPESTAVWKLPAYQIDASDRVPRRLLIDYTTVYYMVYWRFETKSSFEYEWVPVEAFLEGAGMVTDPDAPPEPIDQEIVTPAESKPGEDAGTEINPEVVEGRKDSRFPETAAIAVGGALGAAGIAALLRGGKKEGDGEKKSGYKMYVNKDFGNVLKRGEEPKWVYARIAERTPSGGEATRDDLSACIEVFSGDGVLEVRDGGMVNGYRAALVRVPEDCTAAQGCVSFRYTGAGGRFTRHVVFQLTAAQILFPQENLGLPANKLRYVVERKEPGKGEANRLGSGEYRLPFYVKDMPAGYKLSAEFIKAGATDVLGNYIPPAERNQPIPYSVELQPDPEDGDKGIWLAVIRETGDYELGAGASEGFVLKVKAEYGKPGEKGYETAEGSLPVYRIHLGLAITVESSSVPCYFKLKPGREKKPRDQITGEDLELQYTEGSALLFLCREEDLTIIRVAVCPERNVKVTPTQVKNDRFCKLGDANESHQAIVDKLGICAFPTNQLLDNGARVMKLCVTGGALDAPTRLLADLEFTVKFDDKTYTAVKQVLLRSQPFRVAQNAEDERKFLERDKHVSEQLTRISIKITNEYPTRLFSLADMIDRMLEGYDYRFGFDENQLDNVMQMWVGFLEGSFEGANGTPVGITFADELKAVYAFMQGLRDNTGFLGRVAMGVMTAGVSEYIFTTMTVAEKMRDAVFACKDDSFGFWDGVQIGVEEFGKQILMDIAIGGVMKKVGQINLDIDVTVADKLAQLATKYRSGMDAADKWMKNNFKLYKMGDDALQGAKNFFNSSARTSKAAIDDAAKQADDAAREADELLKKNRKDLTPEELKAIAKEEADMAEGMRKLRELQKAQQELEAVTDPAQLKQAKAKYRKCADEVWTDKNALRQLQRNQHSYAQRMRAQFNEYRETLLDQVQIEALSDIAAETGIPRENLYVMNASNNSRAAYKSGNKVPGDRDISFKQKVLSDRTKDLTINQSLGERAVARRLYKKMNGREADSIQEALDFMEGKDVTYVNPEGDSAVNYVIEHNLEGYADLQGMIGIKPDGSMDKSLMKNDLFNKYLNQQSVSYKAKHWFRKGDVKEGVYQITKQVDNIIIARGILRTGRNPLPPEAMRLHALAKRVGYDVPPKLFEKTLRKDYGLSLEGYADYMSKFLD